MPCRTRRCNGSATAGASSRIAGQRTRSARGSSRSAQAPASTEVLGHERQHVLQRPLLARARASGARRARTTAAPRASRCGAASRGCRRRGGRRRPSRRTRSRARRTAARRRRSGRSAPTTRGRARPGSRASAGGRPRRARSSVARSPSTLQRRPRRSARSPPGAKRSSPRSPKIAPSRGRGAPHDEVDARDRPRLARGARGQPFAALVVEHVDHRRALREAERDLRAGVGGELVGRIAARPRLRPPLGRGCATSHSSNAAASEMRRSTAACEWSATTIIACSSRKRSSPPPACTSRSSWRSALAIEATVRVRPVAVREGVVVGQREQQEVEQVVLHQVGADAAGVLVALARHPELAAAAGSAAREQVGVEQLARAHHRLALEDGAGDAAQRRVARDRVPVAAAVDQVRRAGGAQAGVVEPLEDGRHLGRQVLAVHVVDRVRERAHHAGAAAAPKDEPYST